MQEATKDATRLARKQAEGNGAIAAIYKAMQMGNEMTQEQLEAGNQELKKLWQRLTSMRLDGQGSWRYK